MKIINYINKYKVHIALFIAIVLIILVIMNYNKIIEGYVACGDAKTCSTCVTATLNSANVPCYWNTVNQKCGSFDDPANSNDVRTCPSCTPFTDCSSCIKNGCYWDPSLNRCGQDLSGNYRAVCSVQLNCENYKDCSACTNIKGCYWSNDTSGYKCASFFSPGFSSTCGDPSLCTLFKDCSSCINNGCYWDASTNKCGSPSSGGNYKQSCPSPSCSSFSFTDCSSCIQGNSNCYWNSNDKKCKLNSGSGYSRVCTSDSCPGYIRLPFDTYMQTS